MLDIISLKKLVKHTAVFNFIVTMPIIITDLVLLFSLTFTFEQQGVFYDLFYASLVCIIIATFFYFIIGLVNLKYKTRDKHKHGQIDK